jgi:hypothetical protein
MNDYARGADWLITVDLVRNGAAVNIGTASASLLDNAQLNLRIGSQVYRQFALDATNLPGYDDMNQDAAITNRLKDIIVQSTFTKELPKGKLYADVHLQFEDLTMPDDVRTELVTVQLGRVV